MNIGLMGRPRVTVPNQVNGALDYERINKDISPKI